MVKQSARAAKKKLLINIHLFMKYVIQIINMPLPTVNNYCSKFKYLRSPTLLTFRSAQGQVLLSHSIHVWINVTHNVIITTQPGAVVPITPNDTVCMHVQPGGRVTMH